MACVSLDDRDVKVRILFYSVQVVMDLHLSLQYRHGRRQGRAARGRGGMISRRSSFRGGRRRAKPRAFFFRCRPNDGPDAVEIVCREERIVRRPGRPGAAPGLRRETNGLRADELVQPARLAKDHQRGWLGGGAAALGQKSENGLGGKSGRRATIDEAKRWTWQQ